MSEANLNKISHTDGWIKRFGMAGFIFFFVKGLLWLVVPAFAAYFSLK